MPTPAPTAEPTPNPVAALPPALPTSVPIEAPVAVIVATSAASSAFSPGERTVPVSRSSESRDRPSSIPGSPMRLRITPLGSMICWSRMPRLPRPLTLPGRFANVTVPVTCEPAGINVLPRTMTGKTLRKYTGSPACECRVLTLLTITSGTWVPAGTTNLEPWAAARCSTGSAPLAESIGATNTRALKRGTVNQRISSKPGWHPSATVGAMVPRESTGGLDWKRSPRTVDSKVPRVNIDHAGVGLCRTEEAGTARCLLRKSPLASRLRFICATKMIGVWTLEERLTISRRSHRGSDRPPGPNSQCRSESGPADRGCAKRSAI